MINFYLRYGVEKVYFSNEISQRLSEYDSPTLLLLRGKNSDSGKETRAANFEGIEKFKTEDQLLFPVSLKKKYFKLQ